MRAEPRRWAVAWAVAAIAVGGFGTILAVGVSLGVVDLGEVGLGAASRRSVWWGR
jgi:hypothetical protein